MVKCHICSKQISSTRSINCSKCGNAFHLDCLILLPNELTSLGADWTCNYCKNDGRTLRSGSVSSPAQRLTAPVAQPILSADQFSVLMAKLNEMSVDISTMKEIQFSLKSDLAQCKTMLEQHSANLSRHDAALAEHSRVMGQHAVEIDSCKSGIDVLNKNYDSLRGVVDSASLAISKIESVGTRISGTPSPDPALLPAEVLDRLRRSHNILIRGVPESSPDSDLTLASTVVDYVTPTASSQCTFVTRIGTSTSNRPRMLKISFNNPLVVTRILKNKRVLANVPEWRKYNITDDKTPVQIKELNNLREELKRRLGRGESGIDIKYISGVPTITEVTAPQPSKN